MIVVDASAMIEFLLQTELGARVEARLYHANDEVHVPHLLDLEVLSALRRFVRKGEVSADRAEQAIEDLSLLRIVRHPHCDLIGRVWELRDNVTVYDAAYLALGESLNARVVTCDGPLAAAPGHTTLIELIA